MPLSSEEYHCGSGFSRPSENSGHNRCVPPEHRAGALELAERRYIQAARDFGCTPAETECWVAAIMRKLRMRVEEKSTGQGN